MPKFKVLVRRIINMHTIVEATTVDKACELVEKDIDETPPDQMPQYPLEESGGLIYDDVFGATEAK